MEATLFESAVGGDRQMMGRTSPEVAEQDDGMQVRYWVVILVIAVGIIAAGYLLWQHNTMANQRNRIIEILESQLSDHLVDPDSAKFRSLVLYRDPIQGVPADIDNGSYALCGKVNAKNRMGGYVGYRRFASVTVISLSDHQAIPAASGAFIDDSDEHPGDTSFDAFWAKVCNRVLRLYAFILPLIRVFGVIGKLKSIAICLCVWSSSMFWGWRLSTIFDYPLQLRFTDHRPTAHLRSL